MSDLPGALTYRGPASNQDVHQALLAIDRGEIARLAFVAPVSARWSLPLYELALLAAAHLGDMGNRPGAIDLVTAEREPLAVFGRAASERVRAELEAAGVRLHAGTAPARVGMGGLGLVDGSVIACDRAIALPRLQVAPLSGVPQGPHGFITTDRQMRVEGCADVYAVGDAGWFPVKQGGLAAQQADVAATAIAGKIDSSCRRDGLPARTAGGAADRRRADLPPRRR